MACASDGETKPGMRERSIRNPRDKDLPSLGWAHLPAGKGGCPWLLDIALCPSRGILDPVLSSCSDTSALPLVPEGNHLHTGVNQDLPARRGCSELPGRCREDPIQGGESSDVSSLSHGFCSAFKVLLDLFFFLGKKKILRGSTLLYA